MQQVAVICVLVPGFTLSIAAAGTLAPRLIELNGISSRTAPVAVLFQYIRPALTDREAPANRLSLFTLANAGLYNLKIARSEVVALPLPSPDEGWHDPPSSRSFVSEGLWLTFTSRAENDEFPGAF